MNDHDADPFEAQLRAQPLRPLPEAWREEIFSAALAGGNVYRMEPPSMSHRAYAAFLQWLWPHPASYAALLAAWALVFGLWSATPDLESDQPAGTQLAQENALALAEQRSLYASLREQREWRSLTGNFEEGRP